MIAFDTNVLVRLLVEDDAAQFAAAMEVLERAAAADERCHLSDVVLCETAWVLASIYRASRADVLAALSAVASDARYAFDDDAALRQALAAFEAGRADFADHLIGARAASQGARTTYTFDRKLRDREGFTALG
ncbi:MAG TPA: type II toxin-antitoxin system VapC family toxin [Thermoanaerobaculia bacterium]|nr:type II toxin-antitoxin system VapC family toxin [Thermoanaerobaculia bacterium]